jgi:diaminohydroxyphosphoribosylaminopyrimidine deaminase/5-amino-6-(5-phosphoribosylamino)uracil reductase
MAVGPTRGRAAHDPGTVEDEDRMSASQIEQDAMLRAVELSARGPRYGINPQVGCVILSPSGETLAQGWHLGSGSPHAEVDALARLADPALAHGATAVVTLEPCNHVGRTGPCSEALISAGVARVVYAVDDPGVRSAGGGDRLRSAGVDVEAGVLREVVGESIRPWLTATRGHRPYVTVKWATSLDGRGAAADGSSQWITGPASRADVHLRRADADAIVVGTGTILADDPSLTARDENGGLFAHQPVPVVIGRRPVPAGARVLSHPEPPRIYPTDDLRAALDDLYAAGIRTVFVEGGPTIASAFVAAGLVDECLVYLAPTLIGGPRTALGDLGVATIGEQRLLTITDIARLGADIRIIARPDDVSFAENTKE